jgi:hypothetical protein
MLAAGMMIKRLSVALMGLGLGLLLGSCGPVAGFTADLWPHWAGGLPAGTPPRPGTPGYADYVAHRQAETEPPKPAANAVVNAPAAPAPAAVEPQSDDDRPVTRGGLY